MRNMVRFALPLLCVPLMNAAMPAAAEEGVSTFQQEAARRRPVLMLYQQYADAVRTRGAQGLKSLTTPDFILQGTAEKFKGAAAITELDKYLSLLEKNGQIKIRLRRVEDMGDTLVAYTEETIQGVFLTDKRKDTFTCDWDWKQTWRHTAQGWKLARDERISPVGAKKIKQDILVWTITSRPDDAHSTTAVK